jgi:hypothetical protein
MLKNAEIPASSFDKAQDEMERFQWLGATW